MPHPLGEKHIRAIHAVIITGSVTAAAERLNVTQPALSNRLRDAEERIGFELFERRAGRLVPNTNAMLLFDEIERSFVGLQHIETLCQRIRQQRRRRLSIAATPAFAAVVLPRVLAAIRSRTDDVYFTVESRSAEHVAALTSSRKADIGFALDMPPIPGVRSEVLAEAPMVCYLPRRHRLARRTGTVRAEELRDEPMISLSRSEGIEQVVANAFQVTGGLPAPVVECPAALAACAMAASGVGFVIFDPLPFSLLDPRSVAVRAFEPAANLVYRAFWSESRSQPAELEELISLARREVVALCAQWKRASR